MLLLYILLAVIQFIIKKYSATLVKGNTFQNKHLFYPIILSKYVLGKKTLTVRMETGVSSTSTTGLKEGYSLKQYFLMHRNKKEC